MIKIIIIELQPLIIIKGIFKVLFIRIHLISLILRKSQKKKNRIKKGSHTKRATFTFLTKQPLKDALDWKIRKNLLVKESSINSLINTIDDFAAKHIIKEYNLIENQYKFEWINGGLNKLKKDFINLILFYF